VTFLFGRAFRVVVVVFFFVLFDFGSCFPEEENAGHDAAARDVITSEAPPV